MKTAAAKTLGFGYGTTFGALYGLAHPETKNLLVEGSILGLITWAAGYLGWLPATGIMPPVTEHEKPQVAGAILSHIAFGMVTVGLYRMFAEGD